MKRGLRLGLVAIAAVLGLAFSGTALAAFGPRLIITHERMKLNASVGTEIFVGLDRQDEAVAKATIFAPPGYTASLGQTAGTQIGTVVAEVQARALSPDIFLPVIGTVQVDSPSNWATQSVLCTGTATHQTVWVLVLTASGRELRVPMFIDAAAGAEAAFASLKIQVCLPPPDVPEAAGGAAFGSKLTRASIVVFGVFTTPGAASIYPWIAYFTPYTSFKPPANAAGTLQSRALVPLPVTLTLKGKYVKKSKQAKLSGTFKFAGAAGTGLRLGVFAGTKASALKRSGSTSAVKRNGSYTANRKIKRTTFFQTRMASDFEVDQEGCAIAIQAPPAPAGCNATLSIFASSNTVKVTVRR